MSGPYDDMIDLPRHVSSRHPRMPTANRAAQFMPFAALTGYDDSIKEAARLTDNRIELGDGTIAALDRKLQFLADQITDHPEVVVTFFEEDEKKAGGAYFTVSGAAKKIDEYDRALVLSSGTRIPIEDILDIQSELFPTDL